MRKLFSLLVILCCGLAGSAQVRSYSDNAANTFVFGLDSYFFGQAGSLDFSAEGRTVRASVESGTVSVDGILLEQADGETVIGVHDFTGNHQPELMVARRQPAGVSACLYRLEGGAWKCVGQMAARDGKEIRVFRQVVSIRKGDVLCSWTWHGNRFDYKASDGSAETTSL